MCVVPLLYRSLVAFAPSTFYRLQLTCDCFYAYFYLAPSCLRSQLFALRRCCSSEKRIEIKTKEKGNNREAERRDNLKSEIRGFENIFISPKYYLNTGMHSNIFLDIWLAGYHRSQMYDFLHTCSFQFDASFCFSLFF